MKGLILLFITAVFSGIGWRYCSEESRTAAKKIARDNLMVFIVAVALVVTAIFFSINSTVRFL